MRQETTSANTITVHTGEAFLGYEKDFYKVKSGRTGGVAVCFSHAEIWENNRTSRRGQPGLILFPNRGEQRYIRLVYLTRESSADHDMAIISGMSPESLDQLTQAVMLHAVCKSEGTVTCAWIPKGVAVDPEK